MKRLLSLLLALTLVLGLGMTALADEPEAEQKALVICIDPGHGARDSGAVATYDGVEYQEADLVLQIGLYLREELATYSGVQILMTREDRNGELPTINPAKIKPRTDYAVANGADVLVSLHLNASEKTDIQGAMILSSNGNYRPDVADVGNALGSNILVGLERLGLLNRGHLKTNSNDYRYPDGSTADYHAIVREGIQQNIPSIIVEHCFLTNEEDFRNHLSTEAQLRDLALADAAGIAAYYGLQKKAPSDKPNLYDYAAHWGAPYIDAAIDKGWVTGYPDHTFRPNKTLSRADFVTLLARLSGETLPDLTECPFPDFTLEEYYAESVAWAVDAGIIRGFEDGTFRPEDAITREQMAHIMALYLNHLGLETAFDENGPAVEIQDEDQIQNYARAEVRFCYQNELLKGRGDGFVPQGIATRAEACTILLRLDQYAAAHQPEPVQTPEPTESPVPTEPINPPEEATALIYADPAFLPNEATD